MNNTVVNGNNSYSYVYNYTDQVGNIRMSYGIDPATNVLKIIEESHYYPLELKHSNYNANRLGFEQKGTDAGLALKAAAPVDHNDPVANPSNRYQFKFNGQEYQNEYSLNMTAMDYRQYDNAIGRFNGMDVLTELCRELRLTGLPIIIRTFGAIRQDYRMMSNLYLQYMWTKAAGIGSA